MRQWTAAILLSIIALATNCTPNQRIVESAKTPEPQNITPAAANFDRDLQSMRTADFKFILVFRRIDGAAMDAEDKSFINANTPPDANRRRLADEERAIIIGSNFPFLPGTIDNLTNRFTMENYSKPDSGPLEVDRMANANTDANANRPPQPNR